MKSRETGDDNAKGNPQIHLKRIDELNKAIVDSPGNDQYWTQLGQAYLRLREVPRSKKERISATQRAEEILNHAFQLNERNFDAVMSLADLYTSGSSADFDKAIKFHRKSIELKPDSSRAHVNLGVCYYNNNKYAEAKEVLAHAVKLARSSFAKTFEFHYQLDERKAKEYQGRIYTEEGNLEQAEKVLKESTEGLDELNDRKENYWGCPYQALGRLYSRKGQTKDMVINYIKAAEEQNFTARSQFEAAQYSYLGGYYHMALKYINRAIDISNRFYYFPMKLKILTRLQWAKVRGEEIKTLDYEIAPEGDIDPTKEFNAALESFDKENFDDAMIRIERALSHEMKSSYKVLKGFLFLFQKRYAESKEIFDESLEEGQPDLGAYVGLGHLNIIQKDYQSAVMNLEPELNAGKLLFGGGRFSVDEHQKYDWFCYEMANLGMGWVYANQNMHDAAIKYFDNILAVQPKDLLAQVGKGNSLIGLQRIEEAEKLFEKVLEHYPQDAFALAELALIKYNKGEDGTAEIFFKEALKVGDPKYSCPYEGLGLIYLRQGKLGKAKKNFMKAIEIDPDIQYKKFNGLAKIFINEGKLADAANLLKKSIQNYQHDNEAYSLLETTAQALCEKKDPAGIDSMIFLASRLADRGEVEKVLQLIKTLFATFDVPESRTPEIKSIAYKLEHLGFHDEFQEIIDSVAQTGVIAIPVSDIS